VARVEWSRLSGPEVEAVIAVLLCREFPNATRIKPSQGDGGIDVFVPGLRGIEVYQIKGYTGNLTSTRKGHIRRSWTRINAYAAAESLSLAAWHLCMPENPTTGQLAWLSKLTVAATLPCDWRGLDYLDGLAAKYPDVIDYYLRDGKERLEQVVKSFLAVAGFNGAVGTPVASRQVLEDVHASLNALDPHYRYDFAVDGIGADGQLPPIAQVPGMVCGFQQSDGSRCITFKIIARYSDAVKDRPIPGGFKVVAEPDSELARQLDDFVNFGAPLDKVPATDVFVDLPGGFDGPATNGLVSIGPAALPAAPMAEITVKVLDGADVVAELDFVTDEVSTGISQTGVRGVGHDLRAGVVRYELRIATGTKRATLNFRIADVVGSTPADLLPCLRFIGSIRPPRVLQLAVRHGPSLGDSWPADGEMIPEQQVKLWVDVCESLAVIQTHLFERIGFPDLSEHTWADIESWMTTAALLRGDVVTGKWTEVEIHLTTGAEWVDGAPLFHSGPLTFEIGGRKYEVGTVVSCATTARTDPARSPSLHDGHEDVWLVPGEDATLSMRLATAAEISTMGLGAAGDIAASG
jgi:hypothetical protein